jgi:hypothetical protein
MPPAGSKAKGKEKKVEIDLTATGNGAADNGDHRKSEDHHHSRESSAFTNSSEAVEQAQQDVDRVHGSNGTIVHIDRKMQDSMAQHGVARYQLLPDNWQHGYLTWLKIRARTDFVVAKLENEFQDVIGEPHHQELAETRRTVSIQTLAPRNGRVNVRPQSNIYQFLNNLGDYVLAIEKNADGSVKKSRVLGPFEGYSTPEGPTGPPGPKVGTAFNASSRLTLSGFKELLPNIERNEAAMRPATTAAEASNEHGDQTAIIRRKTDTASAKAGSSKPHPIRSTKKVEKEDTTPASQPVTSSRDEDPEEVDDTKGP